MTMETKNTVGRPTIYSGSLCDQICTRLAGGESLRSICRDDDMPALSTVLLWVVDGRHIPFSEQYTQAREAQGYSDADRIREIAASVIDGELEPQAAKVVIDAFKWTAERNASRAYGSKQAIDHTTAGQPIKSSQVVITSVDPIEAAKQYRDIMGGDE